MMRKLDFTGKARDDLGVVRQWQLQHGSGHTAERRVRSILSAIQRPRDFPCRHPIGDHVGTRQLVIEQYVVIYEIYPDTGRNETAGDVLVLRVFGPGQARDSL